MSMKKNINEEIERIKHVMGLNESVAVNSLDDFPEDLKKTFLNNYLHYMNKFNWNDENEKFMNRATGEYDGEGFRKWMEDEERRQFEKNKTKIMAAVFQDMLNLKKKNFFHRKEAEIEEELMDLFGSYITDVYDGLTYVNDDKFRFFIDTHPKYKKYYDKWKYYDTNSTKYLLMNYNSAVNVPSYADISRIYKFLKTGKA